VQSDPGDSVPKISTTTPGKIRGDQDFVANIEAAEGGVGVVPRHHDFLDNQSGFDGPGSLGQLFGGQLVTGVPSGKGLVLDDHSHREDARNVLLGFAPHHRGAFTASVNEHPGGEQLGVFSYRDEVVNVLVLGEPKVCTASAQLRIANLDVPQYLGLVG